MSYIVRRVVSGSIITRLEWCTFVTGFEWFQLTICRSFPEPLLYVVAMVELQGSENQGISSCSVALLTEIV